MDRPPRKSLFWANVRQAFGIIRANRMRSGLLILGVAIGITTILMMVTVLSGLSRKINYDMVSANRPYLYVQKFDLFVTGEEAKEQMRRKEFTEADAEAMRTNGESIDRVCYITQSVDNYRLHYGSKETTPMPIVGAEYTFPEVYTFHVDKGRYYTNSEERHRERVIILGHGPTEVLFGSRDPIGRVVRLGGKRYEVIGTFESRNHIAGAFSDNFFVIPQGTYRKDFQKETDFVSISANMRPGYELDEGVDEITHILRARRGVRPGDDNDFIALTSESFIGLVRRITVPIGIVLTVIASIGLLVGGIGVMNIMLISVTERTREIGVRMAIGAHKRDILLQFLVEAGTLTGIGGVLGTVTGTIFAFLVAQLIHFPFELSIPWTVISVVFSVFVGVTFGIYPAQRAAKMDPVTALRFE